MQDLLAAMNISKSSLYQAFGGKHSLFRRCIARYTDQIATGLGTGLSKAPSGRRFIEAFLNSILKDVKDLRGPRGCMVMNAATEFAQSEPEIAQDVSRSIGRFRAVLKAAVERAQAEGEISRAHEARTLANYLVSSMSGLKAQSKAGASPETLKGIIAMVMKAMD